MGDALDGTYHDRVRLRRSARARRLSLRISRLDGQVTLTLPMGVPEAAGWTFVAQKSQWLDQTLAAMPAPVIVGEGVELPIEGRLHRIIAAPVRRIEQSEGQLIVPHRAPARAALGWLKALARMRLAAASDAYAARIPARIARLSLRDTRSRWGSCSSQGQLMYSWRLILAPPEVLDYVAAHEVAHLVHMDHSPRFWRQVEQFRPDWRDQRAWLRRHGGGLHRYHFGD